ncbi:MAG: gliding motility protein GldL [Bacteroidales bacterium]|nr:gliding motility protein GldL [Bacteroidales bacterium]
MAIKINLVVRLQHWMDSVPGQTFLNYAYSWGASIVILGALFKLTHLPGGNVMLFIGMGTEVVVFFLSAFDRPFDKSEEGKELPPDYETDEEIAARMGLVDDEAESDEAEDEDSENEAVPAGSPTINVPFGVPAGAGVAASAAAGGVAGGGVAGGGGVVGGGGGGTVIIAGGGVSSGAAPAAGPSASSSDPVEAAQAAIQAATPAGSVPFDEEAKRLAAIIRAANDELLRRAQAVLSPEMEDATQTYIQKLQTLAETFAKVDEQSAKLTKDSEEMENLNRTLTGINKVYELHLKSISLQVGTIDQINSQTNILAQQIEELNGVYGRMIQALTVNMRGTQSAATPTATPAAGTPSNNA